MDGVTRLLQQRGRLEPPTITGDTRSTLLLTLQDTSPWYFGVYIDFSSRYVRAAGITDSGAEPERPSKAAFAVQIKRVLAEVPKGEHVRVLMLASHAYPGTDPFSADIRKLVARINAAAPYIRVELWHTDDLLYNPCHFRLAPQCTVVPRDQHAALQRRLHITTSTQLPHFLHTDIVVRWIGAHAGDIVRTIDVDVERGRQENYFVVV